MIFLSPILFGDPDGTQPLSCVSSTAAAPPPPTV